MRRQVWIGTLFIVLLAGGRSLGAEPPCCEPPQDGLLQRLAPAGGWHPYGGGLLHWWDARWFPRAGSPDDYCRKPLPQFAWPPYPPYFLYGSTDCWRREGGSAWSPGLEGQKAR